MYKLREDSLLDIFHDCAIKGGERSPNVNYVNAFLITLLKIYTAMDS